jgi:excisionase family DNA binding protein
LPLRHLAARSSPVPHARLPIDLIAQSLGVPEDALRALMTERAQPQGDTTLVGLTVAEAARRLGIGRTKMYEYVSSGEIPSVKIGTLRRIPVEAVSAFLAPRP